MKLTLLLFLLLILQASALAGSNTYIVVLGTAQDAGAPQMGCMSKFCVGEWKSPAKNSLVSSIGVVDSSNKKRWIFDATPDLPRQFQMLKDVTSDYSNEISGIFVTHAHIGHYTGLMYLGFESMNAKGVPVYAMPRMYGMLEKNAPWSQLVTKKNIELRKIGADKKEKLSGNISVTPFLVPHRDEFSETVGYRIISKDKSAIFLPDIDKWEKWDRPLADLVRENDYLFLDATFFADGEIPRPISEVPHPFVSETMEKLKSLPRRLRKRVHFIHFNHSNPLLQGNQKAIAEVKRRGFSIAKRGLRLEL